ncbi:HlyD family efflux transporter periplasmic adaptor subunit [Puteibacter caeruleilacunae]|nr:HlyD family efflux transporter periplasmic adaptor subunit [Puteibacter caeruleilacunae]
MDENNLEHIELRSEEVKEIIGHAPGWLMRSGITALFVIVVLFILGSFVFKYPDVINARITVLSENPPAYIVARKAGKIVELKVKDTAFVQSDQVLGVIENPALLADVEALNGRLDQLVPFFNSFNVEKALLLRDDYQLGDVQADYSRFIRLYNDYVSFEKLNYYPQKIKALKEEVRMDRLLYDRLWSQRNVLDHDLRLAGERFRRDSLLFRKGVVAQSDLESTESDFLRKQYDLNEVRTDLAKTQKGIIKLKQDVVNTQKEYIDQRKKLQLELIEVQSVLKSALEQWSQDYVLRSPVDGRISFTSFWSQNQFVKEGEVVFAVIPSDESKIIGRMKLGLKGAGKVKEDQCVNIKFDNYPYMEYGMLKGTVKSISLVPNNDYYIVEVMVPQDLKTNYHIPLEFSQEMKGDAEIVTEDLRLIQRIVNPMRAFFRHRVVE